MSEPYLARPRRHSSSNRLLNKFWPIRIGPGALFGAHTSSSDWVELYRGLKAHYLIWGLYPYNNNLPSKICYKNVVDVVFFFFFFTIFLFFRNAIFTIFSQQILSGRLLLFVISGQKSNLSCEFKLKLITTYHLWCVYIYIHQNDISCYNWNSSSITFNHTQWQFFHSYFLLYNFTWV